MTAELSRVRMEARNIDLHEENEKLKARIYKMELLLLQAAQWAGKAFSENPEIAATLEESVNSGDIDQHFIKKIKAYSTQTKRESMTNELNQATREMERLRETRDRSEEEALNSHLLQRMITQQPTEAKSTIAQVLANTKKRYDELMQRLALVQAPGKREEIFIDSFFELERKIWHLQNDLKSMETIVQIKQQDTAEAFSHQLAHLEHKNRVLKGQLNSVVEQQKNVQAKGAAPDNKRQQQLGEGKESSKELEWKANPNAGHTPPLK